MITNLFSIFDPSTNLFFSKNWISSILIYIFIPMIFWFSPSRINIIYYKILFKITNEIKIIFKKKNNYLNCLILNTLFILIFLNNLFRLFPYIFATNSQLPVSIFFSLTLWISIILYSIFIKINILLVHLTPQGTPNLLISFIVIIELIRNIIRPITLAIRLSANIIAGHLIITLIRNSLINFITFFILILIIQSILIILELIISIIQAYVFSILLTLYSTETN